MSSFNYIIFPLTDLTLFSDLFSGAFLSMHASLYGSDFTATYYNNLHDLFLNYLDLYEMNLQLHDSYNELMEYYGFELLTDFLTAYLASNDFEGDLRLHPDLAPRLETLNRLRVIFMDTYNGYRNSILTVQTGLNKSKL